MQLLPRLSPSELFSPSIPSMLMYALNRSSPVAPPPPPGSPQPPASILGDGGGSGWKYPKGTSLRDRRCALRGGSPPCACARAATESSMHTSACRECEPAGAGGVGGSPGRCFWCGAGGMDAAWTWWWCISPCPFVLFIF
uniref:Uncharacterized protein n=1 Tax=Arundo donax TaxID=35708 RepID=A0A0A9C3K2_ARUDO